MEAFTAARHVVGAAQRISRTSLRLLIRVAVRLTQNVLRGDTFLLFTLAENIDASLVWRRLRHYSDVAETSAVLIARRLGGTHRIQLHLWL